MNTRAPIDWHAARAKFVGTLSAEEQRIFDLLAQGLTQPEIGRQLGLHRSAVWRRIRRLRVLVGSPSTLGA